jgi:uncharacterized repeat protein (TIGR01451 family)
VNLGPPAGGWGGDVGGDAGADDQSRLHSGRGADVHDRQLRLEDGKFKTITGRQIPGSPLAYKVTVGATSIILQALQSADLRLTGTALASVLRGTNYDYTWTIDNPGPGTAKTVVLTDKLPVGVTFVSASPGCTAVEKVLPPARRRSGTRRERHSVAELPSDLEKRLRAQVEEEVEGVR